MTTFTPDQSKVFKRISKNVHCIHIRNWDSSRQPATLYRYAIVSGMSEDGVSHLINQREIAGRTLVGERRCGINDGRWHAHCIALFFLYAGTFNIYIGLDLSFYVDCSMVFFLIVTTLLRTK